MAQSVLEKKLEEYFMKKLDELEIIHIKGNPRGLKGFPDRIVFAHEIFFIELKVGKDNGSYYKPTKMQLWWRRVILGSKGNHLFLEGKEEIDAFLSILQNKKRY